MKLKTGEFICDKCNGKKIIINTINKTNLYHTEYYYKCTRCKGTDKLDWIEKTCLIRNWYAYKEQIYI